jgi:hypothetical protein
MQLHAIGMTSCVSPNRTDVILSGAKIRVDRKPWNEMPDVFPMIHASSRLGNTVEISSSNRSFPSSTSMWTAVAVNTLVTEAKGYTLARVVVRLASTFASPYGRCSRTLPALKTTTAAPGNRPLRICRRTKSSRESAPAVCWPTTSRHRTRQLTSSSVATGFQDRAAKRSGQVVAQG